MYSTVQVAKYSVELSSASFSFPFLKDSTPSGSRNASPAPEDGEPKKKKKKVQPFPS